MTYEEVRDMMLNLEPFNVIWMEGSPSYRAIWESVSEVGYNYETNFIVLRLSNKVSYGKIYHWGAAGIGPAPM